MKIFLFVFLILIAPGIVFGVQDFVPLAPISGVKIGPNTTLPEYINSVFVVIISVAAMLAVLRIVTGGFKYIIEESVSAKGEARGVIQGAIIGLLLLLGSWIILTTINPQIVDLSVLRFEKLKTQSPPSSGSPTSGGDISTEEFDTLRNAFLTENVYLGPGCSLRNPCEKWGSSINTDGLSRKQVRTLERSCKTPRKLERVGETLRCYSTRVSSGGREKMYFGHVLTHK